MTRTSFPPSSIRRDNLHFTSLGGTSQQFGMLHVFNGLKILFCFFRKLKFQAQERSDIGSNLMMNWMILELVTIGIDREDDADE